MKALCKKRNNVGIQNVELFVDELKEFLDHHAFPPCAIINYDETRISFDQKNQKVTRMHQWTSPSRIFSKIERILLLLF